MSELRERAAEEEAATVDALQNRRKREQETEKGLYRTNLEKKEATHKYRRVSRSF